MVLTGTLMHVCCFKVYKLLQKCCQGVLCLQYLNITHAIAHTHMGGMPLVRI